MATQQASLIIVDFPLAGRDHLTSTDENKKNNYFKKVDQTVAVICQWLTLCASVNIPMMVWGSSGPKWQRHAKLSELYATDVNTGKLHMSTHRVCRYDLKYDLKGTTPSRGEYTALSTFPLESHYCQCGKVTHSNDWNNTNVIANGCSSKEREFDY